MLNLNVFISPQSSYFTQAVTAKVIISLFCPGKIFSFAVLVFSIFTIKYAELVPFGNQRWWTMSKRNFNYTVPSEAKSVLKLCFIIWFLEPPSQEQLIPFCFKAIFFPLLLPKVVFRTVLLQSYPFFDMLGALAPANKINSSGLDYTAIDWRNIAPV